MKDQKLAYFLKWNFERINSEFIGDWIDALWAITEVQQKYKKKDMDSILNELHDAMVGQYLGFTLVNTDKHWLDCKYSESVDIFLESKVASFSKSMGATFNDTTFEKAEAFKDRKVWLALSVWSSASSLMFICFWQHEGIWDFLEKWVQKHKDGLVVRSTQSLSLSSLLFDYGFKILSISKDKDQIKTLLTWLAPKTYAKLESRHFISLEEFYKSNYIS